MIPLHFPFALTFALAFAFAFGVDDAVGIMGPVYFTFSPFERLGPDNTSSIVCAGILCTNSTALSDLCVTAPFVLGLASNVAAAHVCCGGDISAGRGGVCLEEIVAADAVGVGGLP
jgi:hypothetical protein